MLHYIQNEITTILYLKQLKCHIHRKSTTFETCPVLFKIRVQEVNRFCIGLMSHILLGIVLEPLLIFAPIFLEKDRLKLRLLCLSTA